MKKITFLLLIVSAALQAQTFDWLQTPQIDFALNPDGIAYPATVDVAGNVYVTGFQDTPVPYNDVMGNVFFNKYDASGNLVFQRSLNGAVMVYEMATDPDGNVLMAVGYLNSIVLGNVGLITINQGVQHLLVKYSPQGDLVWYQSIELEDSDVSDFRALTTDIAGNIYIGYDDYNYSYLAKLTPDGVRAFTITQEHVKMVSSVSVDNQGNIYAAGACAELDSKYAGVDAPTGFTYNTYIAKYNATGDFQWVRYVEDVTCTFPQVKARTQDEVYFSSYLFGSYNFGPIGTEGPPGGLGDFFLTRLNADGDFQWVREVPGNGGQVTLGRSGFLDLDAQGHIYLAGGISGTVDWGNGQSCNGSGYSQDALLLKYDSDGTVLQAITAGGISYDRTDSVRALPDGSVVLTGVCNGSATFGSLNHEVPEFTYFPYITKISAPLSVPQPVGTPLVAYPVPAHDSLQFTQALQGSIYNVLGQSMGEFSVAANEPLAVGRLAAGTYWIRTNSGQSFPFLKQ